LMAAGHLHRTSIQQPATGDQPFPSQPVWLRLGLRWNLRLCQAGSGERRRGDVPQRAAAVDQLCLSHRSPRHPRCFCLWGVALPLRLISECGMEFSIADFAMKRIRARVQFMLNRYNMTMNNRVPQPVLVAGASGFIGRHLVRRLIELGDRVSCLVRATSCSDELRSAGVQLITGDVTDRASINGH
jgi:hypothetical protein